MIVITTQNFAPDIGGMQSYLTGLADTLARKGHSVSVYCDAPRQANARNIPFDRPYTITRFGGPPLWRRWRKARAVDRHLLSGSSEALIADSWKSIEYLSSKIRSHTRVICLAHGAEFLVAPQSAKGARIRSALAKADIVAANSHHTAGLVSPFLSAGTALEVVLPGVEAPLGATPDYSMKSLGNMRLLSIARLDPYKGIDMVLGTLPKLRAKFPALRYDVIGNGKDRDRLLAMRSKLGIGDCVHFHGYVPEQQKAEMLRSADVFVLPNRDEPGEVEGFGIVFAEAGAYGLPCVGGKSGGVSDAVIDGKTGLLVNGRIGSDVEAALLQLLSDPSRAASLGQAAHQRFWKEFHWPAAINRFVDLIQPRTRM